MVSKIFFSSTGALMYRIGQVIFFGMFLRQFLGISFWLSSGAFHGSLFMTCWFRSLGGSRWCLDYLSSVLLSSPTFSVRCWKRNGNPSLFVFCSTDLRRIFAQLFTFRICSRISFKTRQEILRTAPKPFKLLRTSSTSADFSFQRTHLWVLSSEAVFELSVGPRFPNCSQSLTWQNVSSLILT